jgi:hypothetical protein
MRALDKGETYSKEKVLHKDYDRKGSVKTISDREPQGAWRQDELIGGEPPVVNNFDSDSGVQSL